VFFLFTALSKRGLSVFPTTLQLLKFCFCSCLSSCSLACFLSASLAKFRRRFPLSFVFFRRSLVSSALLCWLASLLQVWLALSLLSSNCSSANSSLNFRDLYSTSSFLSCQGPFFFLFRSLFSRPYLDFLARLPILLLFHCLSRVFFFRFFPCSPAERSLFYLILIPCQGQNQAKIKFGLVYFKIFKIVSVL
jgi:hypothetical protein